MSYLAFLAFIVATGLYWLMGPGGPLHNVDFLALFRGQIGDEEQGYSARSAFMLVVAPLLLFALIYVCVEAIFGGTAMLLLGTAALFFAFGREDFPTLSQRFLARARAGDLEGASLVITEAGGDGSAEDADDFADTAIAFFSVMALQRWFGPVIYFLLLGPIGAVAYRLAYLAQDTPTPLTESMMRALDWLPSRLMALSFSLFGDFDSTLNHFADKAFGLGEDTGEFLEDAFGAAAPMTPDAVHHRFDGVFKLLERSFLLWLGLVALLVMI